MTKSIHALSSLKAYVGQEIGVSDWLAVEQNMINAFASSTLDDQWIHIDEERAQNESFYRATVAHGYLILSLIPFLRRTIAFIPDDVGQTINYGADYLRFLNPVRAGEHIRLRIKLIKFEPRGAGQVLLKSRNTIEMATTDAPALVADILTLVISTTQAGTESALGS